jgi:hypothetical protein
MRVIGNQGEKLNPIFSLYLSVPSLLHARELIHFNLREILVTLCFGVRRIKIRIKSSSLGRRIVEFVVESDPSIKR